MFLMMKIKFALWNHLIKKWNVVSYYGHCDHMKLLDISCKDLPFWCHLPC
jgi:hypothetical protein